MRKASLVSLIAATFALPSVGADWFASNSPISQAHHFVLNNELEPAFNSMVEIWQSTPDKAMSAHLNQLLVQAVSKDCGQSLQTEPLPEWLSNLKIVRRSIQNPGRDSYRLVIELGSTEPIKNISFHHWNGDSVSSDSSMRSEPYEEPVGQLVEGVKHSKRYDLTSKLQAGLYYVVVDSNDHQYRSWVLIEDAEPPSQVRWTSGNEWEVDKRSIRDPNCPPPELHVLLFDYNNGEYQQVAGQRYEGTFPTSFSDTNIPEDRYVISVGLHHRRWQGAIILEQAQTLARTFDLNHADN